MTDEERGRRLIKALEYGGNTHKLEHVVALINEGKARFWESDSGDGVVITELIDYPMFRACNYWLISGVKDECLSLDSRICEWAKGEGCKVATASGRRGWGRVSYHLGWRYHAHQFWKPLTS